MNKKVITYILLVGLASLSVFVVFQKQKKSTLADDMLAFKVNDTASVNKFFIASKEGGKVTLERKENGIWMVNGRFRARKDLVNLLLMTFKRTEVKYPAGQKARETIIRNIATKGIKCEIFQNGERTKIWYIGQETPDHTGTFMLLSDPDTDEKYEDAFVTWIPGFEGFLTTRFVVDENDWRDRNVISLTPPQIKSIKMEYVDYPDSSYSVEVLGKNSFRVKDSKGARLSYADTLAIKQYLAYFLNLEASIFLTGKVNREADSVKRTNYFAKLTVEGVQSGKQVVKFFRKPPEKGKEELYGKIMKDDPDNAYILFNNDQDFAIVQFYVFGKVMQTNRYFQTRTYQ